MAEFNKDELQKLPLRERIKRLKELEDQRKKEAKEIESLLKKTETQLKTDEVAQDIAPDTEEVDISTLFGQEEEDLEQTVREQPSTQSQEPSEEGQARYISFDQALEDYEELRDLSYASLYNQGLNEEQMAAVDQIGERLEKSQYRTTTKQVANLVVASKATIHKLKKYAGIDRDHY